MSLVMKLVLSFGFNDTWLIIIWCIFCSCNLCYHSLTYGISYCGNTKGRSQRHSQLLLCLSQTVKELVSCYIMACGFHSDVKETEWLSAQMRSQASALKSQRVSGNQTEVWKRSHSYLLVASKDRGQRWVSYATRFVPCFPCISCSLILIVCSILEFWLIQIW